jgi:hypothetical protein
MRRREKKNLQAVQPNSPTAEPPSKPPASEHKQLVGWNEPEGLVGTVTNLPALSKMRMSWQAE